MNKKDIYEHLAKIYLDASSKSSKKKSKLKAYPKAMRSVIILGLVTALGLASAITYFHTNNRDSKGQIALFLYQDAAKINFNFEAAKEEIYSINLNKLSLARFKTLAFSVRKAHYENKVSELEKAKADYEKKSLERERELENRYLLQVQENELKLRNLENEKGQITRDYEQKIRELILNQSNTLREYERKFADFSNFQNRLLEEMKLLEWKTRQEKIILEEKIQNKDKEVSIHKEELEQKIRTIEEKNKEQTTLKSYIDHLDVSVKELEDVLNKKENEIKNLEDTLGEKTKSEKELKKYLDEMKNEFTAKKDEIKEELSDNLSLALLYFGKKLAEEREEKEKVLSLKEKEVLSLRAKIKEIEEKKSFFVQLLSWLKKPVFKV